MVGARKHDVKQRPYATRRLLYEAAALATVLGLAFSIFTHFNAAWGVSTSIPGSTPGMPSGISSDSAPRTGLASAETPRVPTSTPILMYWYQSQGAIPASGSVYDVTVDSPTTVMFTGGQVVFGGHRCAEGGRNNCVFVIRTSGPATLHFSELYALNNWTGKTGMSPNAALDSKRWEIFASNCPDYGGCDQATILFFEDSRFVSRETISP